MKIYNTQIFIFFSAQDGGHDMSVIDEHGQPIIRSTTNKSRLMDRSIDELIGFCKGTIADGVLNQDEAESLLTWIKLHPNLATTFPANVLFARLCDALDDGKLDSEEARDVFELIAECVGASGEVEMVPCTSTLPIDNPPPELFFPNRNFVLTGRFAWGPRQDVASVIEFLGGCVKNNVSGIVDYLICGHFGSTDWIHSSHGRKIEAAIDFRSNGYDIAIISERYWADVVREII
jgi:NAD-dependent DNA ligase